MSDERSYDTRLARALHLNRNQLDRLLRPSGDQPLLDRQRAGVIIFRVRLVSLLFAILTPLWIIVDILVMTPEASANLAVARIVASTAFGLIAAFYPMSSRLPAAWGALGLMLLVPIGFFLFSHPYLASQELHGLDHAIASGYAFLPFIMAAGLSLFPLTLLEGALYAVPVLAAQLTVLLLELDATVWTTHVGALWLLLLISVVATCSGMSQLHLMDGLIHESSQDPLTGALTRRVSGFLLKLQEAQSRRRGEPWSVAFFDLDDFKCINDRFGHEAGDVQLRQATQAITDAVRSTDLVIRWGGEEFLLSMPDTDSAQARLVVDRIFTRGLGNKPDGTPLTTSVGIATLDTRSPEVCDWRSLVEAADKAMYEAKRNGGNQISLHESAAPRSPHPPELASH